MEFIVTTVTYNSYGAHRTLADIGHYLSMACEEFGSAVAEIYVDVHFPSRPGTRPTPTLEGLYEEFHQNLEKLPTIKFFRKKNRIAIEFMSQSGYANDPHVGGPGDPDLGLYCDVFREMAAELAAIRSRIKPSDDFRTEAFLEWFHDEIEKLPRTQDDLVAVAGKAEAHFQAKLARMDEWERLAIDWIDYHKDARTLLNETFYWDCADDFAPHGNDAGADLLHNFEEWRPHHKGVTSEAFFEALWQSWWAGDPSLEDVTRRDPDDLALSDYDRLTVALAFAHLKHDAACPPWIRNKALESIDRQRAHAKSQFPEWDHLSDFVTKMGKMEAKLKTCAVLE